MTNLTLFDYKSNTVRFRPDGWGSLTDMAKATGKRVNNWTQTDSANEYLEALSLITGIPVIGLIDSKVGGNIPEMERGTWAHPKVCIRFAQWCNPKFAVWVDFKIDELIRTGSTQLADFITPEPKRAITYYSDRVMHLKAHLKVPNGYWCCIQECGHLLLDVERMGYQVNEFDLLDGSIGTRWGNFRKDKSWAQPTKKASYKMPGKLFPVKINAYVLAEIVEFKQWLPTYEANNLMNYLVGKYGTLAKVD